MKNLYPYISTAVLILAIIGGIWIYAASSSGNGYKKNPSALDSFAECLASKKITMYGAIWCSHCQNEKKGFGDSFRFVPYVECPDNIQLCLDKGIKGYPTWIFGDGRVFEGEQGVEKLSQESGCPLPANAGATTGANADGSSSISTTTATN